MNSARFKNFLIALDLIVLSACSPQATPPPSPTAPPTSPTATVAPIDLAGPPMAVGSTYLYADGSVLVAVPAGPFIMGNGRPDSLLHTVNLSDFWIYKTKVTNSQYAYCVAMGMCTAPFGPDNPGFYDPLHTSDPVVGVNYDQAAAYCTFVSARLPTEAEWEKTARGPDGNVYPWGDGKPGCSLLNYSVCVGKVMPVNTYPDG